MGRSTTSRPDFGAGLLGSIPDSGPERLGVGKSASGPVSARFCFGGIAGIDFGTAGIAGLAPGNGMRALQLSQVTDLVPGGTSPSAMRLTVPHAAQVASIIRR
ncbi:MAG TPA: hypothetical protein VGG74_33565 [Kofleriaceae bacterium]